MGRLLNPKVYDDQNSIIAQKYYAGWKINIIAGYVGISSGLLRSRLEILKRDGKIVLRSLDSGN